MTKGGFEIDIECLEQFSDAVTSLKQICLLSACNLVILL